jgi:hypothetical protein
MGGTAAGRPESGRDMLPVTPVGLPTSSRHPPTPSGRLTLGATDSVNEPTTPEQAAFRRTPTLHDRPTTGPITRHAKSSYFINLGVLSAISLPLYANGVSLADTNGTHEGVRAES